MIHEGLSFHQMTKLIDPNTTYKVRKSIMKLGNLVIFLNVIYDEHNIIRILIEHVRNLTCCVNLSL